MPTPADATVVVTNDAYWYGDQRLGAIGIYVDGRRVGTALPRSAATIAVAPGAHSIRIRQWWFRSSALTVDLGAGDIQRLAGTRPTGLSGFTRLLLRPFQALALLPTQDR